MRQKCTTKMYSEIMMATNYNTSQLHILYIYICNCDVLYLYMHFQNTKPWSNTLSKQHICILLAAVPTKSTKLLGSLYASSHEILSRH